MLETISALRRFGIQATDGEIGEVADVFFDDETWTARYFVIETGGWLRRRRVLISPIAVVGLDERARMVAVDLTREQIAQGPHVDTNMPLSRQMELKYRDLFSWPLYWVDTYLEAYSPAAYPLLAAADKAVRAGRTSRKESLLPAPPKRDPHLRSAATIMGYAIMATDGHAGRLDDFIIDTDGWVIRSLVVHVERRGKNGRALLPPDLVEDIRWPMSTIHARATRRQIDSLPQPQAASA